MIFRRCPRSNAIPWNRGSADGFSLIEIMAALMLLAVSLTIMLDLRNRSIGKAAEAHYLSVASRLGLQLLHRIEAGRVADLFDGYTGDFSDSKYPNFVYVIGIGDGSAYASGALSEEEEVWREAAEEEYDEEADAEEKPPMTRVFITITYPNAEGEEAEFNLETLCPTWAVYQDFELYDATWAGNLPEEVQ